MRFEDTFIRLLHQSIMLSGSDTPIKEIVIDKSLFDRISFELMSKTQYKSWSMSLNHITLMGVKIRTQDDN